MLFPKIVSLIHKGLHDLVLGLYPIYAPGRQTTRSFQLCKTLSDCEILRIGTMTYPYTLSLSLISYL